MNLEYLGSFICHQISERTIQIDGRLLPLCSRCTGIYTGFFLGVLYQFTLWQTKIKELPNLKISLFSILLLGFLIIDPLGSHFGLWSLSNYPRLILGLLGGASISLFLFPVFNYSLFAKSEKDKGIKRLSQYLGLLLLLCVAVLFIFIGNFVVYNIVALISILGIFLIYSMVIITIIGRIIKKFKGEGPNAIKQ